MKQRKTMRLWQMIVILVLSIAMLVTMFLPAFKISGSSISKGMKKIAEESDQSMSGEVLDAQIESITQEIDEGIKECEEEYGVKLSRISAFNIMTKSFTKLLMGDNPSEEDRALFEENEIGKSIKSKFGLLRILLWVVYGLVLIVLVMTILGFCLKMSKHIPLIISTLYSIFAVVLFGYLRFALLKGIGKKLVSVVVELFNTMSAGMLGTGITSGTDSTQMVEILSRSMPEFMASFYGIGFLAAFIIAILMLIFSILSMFIGNRQPQEEPQDEHSLELFTGEHSAINPPEPPVRTVGPDEHMNGGGSSSWNEPPKVIKQAPKPMGLVRCTKGVAAGTGFSLPQDRKVIVGKSPQNANLVINNINVSNVHCSIRYNAATNTYLIKDHSMNGTFASGIRLQKDVTMEFPAGTVLSLADGSNEITLG